MSGSWRRIERKPRAKVRPFFLVDRDLQHAGQLIFHRVFDGDDLVHPVVDLGDHRVQRGGLAAAGGAGHQHHAVGFSGQTPQLAQGFVFKAQSLQLYAADLVGQVLFVEHPQHRVFAEDARHDRHPEVDLPAADADLEATVLGHAFFADVQFGHDLDPGNHLLGELAALDLADVVEHAVDPVLDHQTVAGGAEVDVAGVHFQRVVQGRVDQFHHHARVFADAGQRQALQGVGFAAGVSLGVERFDGVETFFVAGQISLEVVGMHQIQRCAMQAFIDPGQARGVEGVGEHTDDFVVVSQQDEFTFEALRQGDPIEHRRRLEQGVGVEHRVMQGSAEAGNERHRRQFAEHTKSV